MGSAAQFIEQFTNINGVTVGERKKIFFKNLDTFQKTNPAEEEIIEICQNLKPQTKLEESLKIEFLIRFKRFFELLEILKGEDIALIKKVGKQKWFFGAYFEKISADVLINEVFSKASHNTRMMILTRLRSLFRNEELSDEYFEGVRKAYGLSVALKIMPCCSAAKILEIANSYGIIINDKFLVKHVKIDSAFLHKYFDAIVTYKGQPYCFNDYKKCLRYLADKHVDVYYDLFQKYQLYTSLNKKCTAQIMKKYKEDVIAAPSKFIKVLYMPYVLSYVKEDFTKFYINLYPKDVSNFSTSEYITSNAFNKPKRDTWDTYNAMYCCLYRFKNEDKYKILSNAFKTVYSSDITEYDYLLRGDILKILPKEFLLKLVKSNLGKENENDWLEYLPVEESIPLIKKKISLLSEVRARGNLLKTLVKTCSFNNKDTATLLDVLNYVSTKHRNDDHANRSEFLGCVKDNFDIKSLSNEHWVYINNMIQVMEINKDYFHHMDEFIQSYVYFLLEQDLPVKEEIVRWLKTKSFYSFDTYTFLTKYPKFEKKCLNIIGYVLPEIYNGEDLEKSQVTFVGSLLDWNKRHPQDSFQLTAYPLYINSLKEQVAKGKNSHAKHLLLEVSMNKEWAEAYNLYPNIFTYIEGSNTIRILRKLLNTSPTLFSDNVDKLTELHYDRMLPICHDLLMHQHLGLPQKIIEHSVKQINDPEKSKTTYIYVLANLMSPHQFVTTVSNYIPTDSKMDVKEGHDDIWTKTMIVKCLIYPTPLSECLETILKFCGGDFLSYALNTIYYVVQYVPTNKLHEFISKILDRAVSVRKHGVFLSANVRDTANNISLLKSVGKTEKNPSIRKFIIKVSFNYFCKNPSQESWETFIVNSRIMEADDEEAYNILADYRRVPNEYFSRFIEAAWNIFESAKENFKNKRFDLILCLSESQINKLNPDFCHRVLEDVISSNKTGCMDFCFKYVTLAENEAVLSKRMKTIFDILKEKKESEWNRLDSEIRKLFHYFIQHFCLIAASNRSINVVQSLNENFDKMLKPHDAFEEYLKIKLTLMFLNVENDDEKWFKLGVSTSNILDKCVSLYSSESLDLVFQSVRAMLDEQANCSDDMTKFTFFEGVLQGGYSRASTLLVIYLLPDVLSKSKIIRNAHLALIERLKQQDDIVIQIHYNNYVRKLIFN